jgi:ribonuclease E
MKLLMPSHVKKVVAYADAVPLFQRFGAEDQLAAMYQPIVQLKSGGYLVINPTEALVSIDINSGRSTREHNIEQTAVSTNLEAAHEIARQLRLRDMAGLIVVDFIDMESNSNNRKVEKAMKEALKNDRARIQVGRISGFGLFEMSRQRLRTGVLEASTRVCPHCEGTGLIRTASSAGLSALRMLEEEAARGRGSRLVLRASQEAALYVLNRKRAELAEIEDRYGVIIEILSDGTLEGARMAVECSGPPPEHAPRLPAPIVIDQDDEDDFVEEEEEEEEEARETAEHGETGEQGETSERGRRRRRRRRRGGRREETETGEQEGGEAEEQGEDAGEDADEQDTAAEAHTHENGTQEEGGHRRRGRRGRRGGRRHNGEAETAVTETEAEAETEGEAEAAPVAEAAETPVESVVETAEEEPAKPTRARRRPRARKSDDVQPVAAEEPAAPAPEAVVPVEAEAPAEAEPAKPKRTRRKAEPAAVAEEEAPVAPKRRGRPKKAANDDATPAPAAAQRTAKTAAVEADSPAETANAENDENREGPEGDAGGPRRGWWQRTFGN